VIDPQVTASAGGPLEASDDAALASAALDGRPEAFDVLVVRHRQVIYQVCYRFLGSHEDAADAAQEAFLRAYRSLHTFKGRSAFGTWLYRIAVNLCLTRLPARRGAVEVALDDDLPARPAEDALERMIAVQNAERVRRAVARLPGKQRAALVLRVYHELTHREIASILGTSVGAVKANVFHALRNLRKLLGGEA
jgi:RNA polymerase sigma-70 factor (ECF subfamily)